MVREIRISRNHRGEWSVADLVRDYRICNYNHEAHGGPHVHAPLDGPRLVRLDLETEAEAEEVLRAFAKNHDRFNQERFLEVYAAWKSELKSD